MTATGSSATPNVTPASSPATSAPQVGSASPAPLVGIVMGSDSDWPVMRAAAQALDEFAVPYEADVVSAHRMPRDMIEYGSSAEARGLRVIIAGAGGAAHLPGMLASVTPLPVIGVPVPLANLGGLDSLLSIVQMPAGIPVATVAVGGARNAGLLAVRIHLYAAESGPGLGAAANPRWSCSPSSWRPPPAPRAPPSVTGPKGRLSGIGTRACCRQPSTMYISKEIRSPRRGGGHEHRRDAGRGPPAGWAERQRGQ